MAVTAPAHHATGHGDLAEVAVADRRHLVRCEGPNLTREKQQGRLACLAKQNSAWWLP